MLLADYLHNCALHDGGVQRDGQGILLQVSQCFLVQMCGITSHCPPGTDEKKSFSEKSISLRSFTSVKHLNLVGLSNGCPVYL